AKLTLSLESTSFRLHNVALRFGIYTRPEIPQKCQARHVSGALEPLDCKASWKAKEAGITASLLLLRIIP
ncbi:MAG: hypothetical protein K1W02_10220, partial [Muribaculaceae bacterium]